MLTATYDGRTLRVYKNGVQIGSEEVELENDQPQVRILPLDAWERRRRIEGDVRDFAIWDTDLPASDIKKLWEKLKKD